MPSPLRHALPPASSRSARGQLSGPARDRAASPTRRILRCAWTILFVAASATLCSTPALAREPIPDRLVVLTFDDAVKSQFTIVRPILLQHKFRATFFVTEGFNFKTDKEHYMTWEEIAHLHRDGFEIGNHTRDHMSVTRENLSRLKEQIEAINARCAEFGLPRTSVFAYPGNGIDPGALPILKSLGFKFARRGGAPEFPYKEGRGFAYEPGLDHPLLIPSAGDARPDWTLDNFKRAVDQAHSGRIAVLQFHGAPDIAHPWVNSPVERFREYMQYLADHHFHVIALGDLERYVDPANVPTNPQGAIEDRRHSLERKTSRDNVRPSKDDADLRRWLENMVWYHHFTTAEIRAATGLSTEAIDAARARFAIRRETKSARSPDATLLVLPYPGGRHPRIGFLDGAIRPQRETKLSVFTPWEETAYVVLDIPEAIRRNDEKKHGLLYLAHTHADTMWTRQHIDLAPQEWQEVPGGTFLSERRLPNGVAFGARATPFRDQVAIEMWLTNGSQETLRELTVQNCVMLKGAPEFAAQTNTNKVFSSPYAACRSDRGNRWVVTAFEPCRRAWGNPPCPCLHSDPTFGDCPPGQTQHIVGRLSFYEGTDISAEVRRIDATGWRNVRLIAPK
ncbi:MAG TPA: polysaccharide deacetylase family protein [Planctomycetaceae bacterium]|jgi:peptidoglycan/xylan/chitin deacetylase (PgdA/CDA1 family)|nr:polysaccharide deacetylase family protein [Planctomycetaceae bacterium]